MGKGIINDWGAGEMTLLLTSSRYKQFCIVNLVIALQAQTVSAAQKIKTNSIDLLPSHRLSPKRDCPRGRNDVVILVAR